MPLCGSCAFAVRLRGGGDRRYNKKYKGDKEHPPIGWPELDPTIDAFKHKNIFSEMVKTEVTEKVIFTWLDTIAAHTFAPAVAEGGEGPPACGSLTHIGRCLWLTLSPCSP